MITSVPMLGASLATAAAPPSLSWWDSIQNGGVVGWLIVALKELRNTFAHGSSTPLRHSEERQNLQSFLRLRFQIPLKRDCGGSVTSFEYSLELLGQIRHLPMCDGVQIQNS